jgi:hypothetical protein
MIRREGEQPMWARNDYHEDYSESCDYSQSSYEDGGYCQPSYGEDTPSLSAADRAALQQRVALLTDLIELGEGKTPQALHPEMSEEQLCDHMSGLARFSSLM